MSECTCKYKSANDPDVPCDHCCEQQVETLAASRVEDLPLAEKAEWFINRVFGGRHHCRRFEDNGAYFLVVPNSCHSFSTYDGDRLTKIVMMSHLLCLRAEVECNGMVGLRVLLHNRVRRLGGNVWQRHPTVSQIVKEFPELKIEEEQS